jgi:hypothetical protein
VNSFLKEISVIIQRAPKKAWRYFISLLSPMEQSRQPKDIYFIADEPFVSFVATNYPNRGGWPAGLFLCVWQIPTNKAIYQSRLRCRALSLSAPFGVCAHTLCCCCCFFCTPQTKAHQTNRSRRRLFVFVGRRRMTAWKL